MIGDVVAILLVLGASFGAGLIVGRRSRFDDPVEQASRFLEEDRRYGGRR